MDSKRFVDHFTEAQRRALRAEIDCFVFDCDGVLWAGDHAINGASELLHQLGQASAVLPKGNLNQQTSQMESPQAVSTASSANSMVSSSPSWTASIQTRPPKQVVFVTNNATKTKAAFEAKFQGLGFPLPKPGTMMSSGIATASYLESKLKHGDIVYVVGEPGLHETIRQAGLQTFGQEHSSLTFKDFISSDPKQLLSNPDLVKAVVLSFCGSLSYYQIAYASTLVRYCAKDILFVCTNLDQASPLTPGMLVPGGGACVAPIVVGSGREPLCMGKPSKVLAQQIVDKVKVDPSRMLMVGDRLNTDMKFGKSVGMRTLLVLSGATSSEEAWSCTDDEGTRPDFIATSVEKLVLKNFVYAGSDVGSAAEGYAGDISSAGELTADESSRPSAKRRRRSRN